jgi:uncharacterized membrane protein YGL010W
MRSVDQWLEEYGESHRNPVNKALHWACVPPIVMTVLGLLWSIPVPGGLAAQSPWVNWATLGSVGALGWYALLSPALAIGLVHVLLGLLATVAWLDTLAWPLWQTSLAIFVVAWIGQFIGHAIEGKRPSFFKDAQFLLIGPLWLLAFVYRAIGLRYSRGARLPSR